MAGSYVVLARKYRPQNFEAVVGQNPVAQTLLNALESGRVAHAYIFSGPRGVGKTTTARILAKCLNCEKGPAQTPCDKCASCISITRNNSVDDVLEIDGASNRGIEQIRELRESAKYAPSRSRYRIFIIDEAHQITKDAFGALLKTLEEPPDHVVFMMATTEVQKIPAPILSRCQRFALRPISPELVFNHLRDICQKEKIKVEDSAVADIVRFVEGSLRDALSLLDQAIVFAPDGITSNTVRDLLGLLPLDVIRKFFIDIQSGDPAAILKNIDQSIRDGVDLTQLAKDLQAYCHSLLLAKAGVEETFSTNGDALKKEASAVDFATLERSIRLLARALDDMRRSETPRAVFEVYALRLGQKTLDPRAFIERLEQLEKGAPPAPPPASKNFQPASPAISSFKPAAPKAAPPPAPLGKKEAAEEISKIAAAEPEPAGPVDHAHAWKAFINEIAGVKQSLASAIEEAAWSITHNRLTLTFQKSFHQDIVNRALDTLKEPFMKHFKFPLLLDTRVDKNAAVSTPVAAATAPAALEPFDSPYESVPEKEVGAKVQEALKHFPGALKRERRPS